MFKSLSNSYHLVRQSWSIPRQDRELLVFPVLSGLTSIAIGASFVIPLFLAADRRSSILDSEPFWYVFGFAFYLATYFITIFFNVGVMCCAAIRMDGGDPTVADGFKGAVSHIGSIFAWSLLSATVGIVLQIIEDKADFIGKVVASVFGIAWTLLTFFVVPVMIFERRGVGGSIRRSTELFKKTWGETVIGNAGINLFFSLLGLIGAIPLLLAVYLTVNEMIGMAGCVLIVSSVVAYWIILAVVSSALTGIFHVALYRFAATGTVPSGFDAALVRGHWRPKSDSPPPPAP